MSDRPIESNLVQEISIDLTNSPKTCDSNAIIKNLPKPTAKLNLISDPGKLRSATKLQLSSENHNTPATLKNKLAANGKSTL